MFVILTSTASLSITSNKFFHNDLASLVLAAALAAFGWLLFTPRHGSLARLLEDKRFWVGCLVLFAVGDLLRYPIQSRKPNFETAAPALIEPALHLARGHDPYGVHLGNSVPISPGPGWIVLLMPLTLSGAVMLVTPFVAAMTAAALFVRSSLAAGVFMALLLMQPNFLSQTTVGHDLFAIPIAFSALCLLGESSIGDLRLIVPLAVVAASFATSRLPMIVLVLFLCVGLYRRHRRSGVIFAVISIPLTAVWHVAFYLWARSDHTYYQPLHLLGRAASTGTEFPLIGLLGGLVVCLWAALRMRGLASDWMLAGALFLVLSFVPEAIGELVALHGNFAAWEGANYLSFGDSLLVAYLALTAARRDPDLGRS